MDAIKVKLLSSQDTEISSVDCSNNISMKMRAELTRYISACQLLLSRRTTYNNNNTNDNNIKICFGELYLYTTCHIPNNTVLQQQLLPVVAENVPVNVVGKTGLYWHVSILEYCKKEGITWIF